jgi:predicted RNase H-like nuclease (RuvC/YqgF family)
MCGYHQSPSGLPGEGRAMDEELEELRKEVARLSIEVKMLKAKVMSCLEAIAKLREEFEGFKRKVRKPSLIEYMKTLRACEEDETDGPEPP